MRMFKHYFQGILHDRYILMSLVNRDLQSKYRKSYLGVAWSILTPLSLVLIIGTVYTIIFKVDPRVFIPSLFAGLTPWLMISGSADGGTNAFFMAEGYLKQTSVNSQIFPIRNVAVQFINFCYSLLAYFSIYLFLQPERFGPRMLFILPSALILFLFALGWANISSVVNLHIRDFQPLQSIVLQGLFYVTPIIYPKELVAEAGFEVIYRINPVYYMVEIIRVPLMGESIPSLSLYGMAFALAAVLFAVSVVLQMKTKKGIALHL